MKIGIFLIDNKNRIFGHANMTKWDNAKWWQKIIGNISKKYKYKFIDIKPLKGKILNKKYK